MNPNSQSICPKYLNAYSVHLKILKQRAQFLNSTLNPSTLVNETCPLHSPPPNLNPETDPVSLHPETRTWHARTVNPKHHSLILVLLR